MKQPELGQLISEGRKQKGFTQMDLAGECNVDIRTIQRIEAGEVTPRFYTLRIINEVLGTDFDLNGTKNNGDEFLIGSQKIIRYTWIAGIILILFLPFLVFEAFYPNPHLLLARNGIFALTIIYMVVSFFYYSGLLYFGRKNNLQLLPLAAFLTILVMVLYNTLKILNFSFEIISSPIVFAVFGYLFGITSILLGVAFILIHKVYRELAISAGILQLIAGLLYFFAGLFGIIFGSIALILQVVFLVKAEKRMMK